MENLKPKLSPATGLALVFAACLAVICITAWWAQASLPGWYSALTKPHFLLPFRLLAASWVAVLIASGLGAFKVLNKGWSDPNVQFSLVMFAFQLVLSVLYAATLFAMHSLFFGLLILLNLITAAVLTALTFAKVSRPAAWLSALYPAWYIYAAAANLWMFLHNATF